jgi:hypothetical protein
MIIIASLLMLGILSCGSTGRASGAPFAHFDSRASTGGLTGRSNPQCPINLEGTTMKPNPASNR